MLWVCLVLVGAPLGHHWGSIGFPLGFHWVSTGFPLGLHWGSTGFPLGFYQQAQFVHRFYFPNATFFVVVVYRFSFPVLLSRSPCRCFRLPCSGYQVSFHRAFFTNVFVLTVIKTYVEKEKPSNAESVVWGRGTYTYRYVDF